ncbi:MAG TPA: DUF6159 family protein [Candidatus Eisenbacteria bacterium]|nr:DUF6159 family protein [Candidatus Eisenbacteria bacterium]
MGRLSRSWDLVVDSFSILWGDKQLLMFPVLSGISCVIVTLLLLAGGAAIFLPQLGNLSAWIPRNDPQAMMRSPELMGALFALYMANYFVIIFFNVALVGVANSRLTGGNWTFDQGLQLAWKRKWVILQWAFIAATVGMALRALSERAGFIGRMVVGIIGIAWNLANYFVVPVLAFEDLSPGAALYRSAELFKETWGEKVVGGFSLGIIFSLLMLPGALVWIGMINFAGPKGLVAGGIIMAAYMLLLSVVSSAVQGIFNAALYRYACDQAAPPGFSKGLIESAWQARD